MRVFEEEARNCANRPELWQHLIGHAIKAAWIESDGDITIVLDDGSAVGICLRNSSYYALSREIAGSELESRAALAARMRRECGQGETDDPNFGLPFDHENEEIDPFWLPDPIEYLDDPAGDHS